MSPKQIAEALDKNINTVRNILAKMVREGDIKMPGYAKYTTIDTVDTVDASSLQEKKDIKILLSVRKRNVPQQLHHLQYLQYL